MKKKFLVIVLFVSFSVTGLFANPVKDFAEAIAYGIYQLAWPSATYKNVEVEDFKSDGSSKQIILKFNGNSNQSVCFVGDCPLWFTLKIYTDQEFHIQSMSVIEHNAILQPPFKTSGAIAQAVANANSK